MQEGLIIKVGVELYILKNYFSRKTNWKKAVWLLWKSMRLCYFFWKAQTNKNLKETRNSGEKYLYSRYC